MAVTNPTAAPSTVDPNAVDPNALLAIGDPTGQGGGGPIASTTYTDPTKPVPLPTVPPPDLTIHDTSNTIDPMNPPVELFGSPGVGQFVKSGMITAGAMLGGAAGVPAGGGVADVATVPAGMYLGGMAATQAYDWLQNTVDALRGETNQQGEPITLPQQAMDAFVNGTLSLMGGWGQELGQAGAQALNKALAPLVGKAAPYVGQGVTIAGRVLGGGAGVGAATGVLGVGAASAKIWGLLPPEARTPDMLQTLKDMEDNAGLDMLVNGALHTPIPAKILARNTLFKLYGITPEMISNADTARGFGIPIAMTNLSNKNVLATFIRTVASVIGHPYLDLQDKQTQAINRYAQDLPQRTAPSGTGPLPTVEAAGNTVLARANDAFKRLVDVYTDNFNMLVARATVANVRFSIDSTRGMGGNAIPSLRYQAQSILNDARAESTPQVKTAATGLKYTVKSPAGESNVSVQNQDILDLANKIANAPKVLTARELDVLAKEADDVFVKYVQDGDKSDARVAKLGAQIKSLNESIHAAFSEGYDPNGVRSDIGDAINANDRQYSDARELFNNATGAKLNKRSIKIPGDVLGDAFFKTMDSPQQIDELRHIVGDEAMNSGVSAFLKNIVSTATEDAGTPGMSFNTETFAKAIDADNPSSNRYQAVSRALETSGIRMQDLVNFVKASRLSEQNKPPGLATMLIRKMTFGGFGSLVKVLVPIGAAETGHSLFGAHVGGLETAAGILLSWKGADIMSNPEYLRDATTFLNTANGEAVRRMAMWRVAKAVLPSDQWAWDAKDKNAGTGKTPPKTIVERVDRAAGQATDAYFQGSEFLNKTLTQPGSLQ
jgi:hypothetical protein